MCESKDCPEQDRIVAGSIVAGDRIEAGSVVLFPDEDPYAGEQRSGNLFDIAF